MAVVGTKFEVADAGQPPASELIAAMIAELEPWYGRIDAEGTPTATPADFAAPDGTFLIAKVGDEVVAGGGVKRLSAAMGEIKRMYVVPSWRGRSVGSSLLAALESAAAELGMTTVRLDTGVHQPVAIALYERRGYRQIPDYNGNPKASFWGEKQLAPRGR